MSTEWLKIKNEYINTGISYRKLAEKHNVSFATLQVRAKKESWTNERDKQYDKVETMVRQKTANVIVGKEVDRIARITSLADQLSDKLEQAIEELDRTMVTHKKKTRTIEYKDKQATGKPTKETIEEEEKLVEIASIIDKAGLKQLTGALKDIKEIVIDKDSQPPDNTDNSLLTMMQQAAKGIDLNELDAAEPETDGDNDVVDEE